MAREQAEVAAEQSRAVMVFTIFTIVFLPLSFFSSIFGMNVREWSGTDTNLGLNYIIKVMGSISVGVIFIPLLVAFNYPTRRLMKALWGRSANSTTYAFKYNPMEHMRKVADRSDPKIRGQSMQGGKDEILSTKGRRRGLKKRFTIRQYDKSGLEDEISRESYEV